ncbi:MAG: DUF5684 domain-containing protein, partial [Candidatus Eremiobacterota bacterium]
MRAEWFTVLMGQAASQPGLPELGALLVPFLLVAGVLYVYFAVCLSVMASKTGTPNGWMAWVPLLNLLLLCHIAGKSPAWLLGCLVPFFNLVAVVVLWMGAAERRGKSPALGLLILLPPVSL